ncbi:BORC8 protein, partial [Polypterus senegalus]
MHLMHGFRTLILDLDPNQHDSAKTTIMRYKRSPVPITQYLKIKKGDGLVTDKFTESMYVLANEPSVALYRLQEHVRRSLPELVQHKTDMQGWEEQSQGAIYTVEYACSAVKSMTNSTLYFKSIEGLLRETIGIKDQMNSSQGRR